MHAAQLLETLDPMQRQAAQRTTGPVAVRAGAGTGKTRAITYRIAYAIAKGDMKPEEVLAVTFTKKAAVEMRERLAQLGAHGVQAKTFHAAALDQLRYFWPTAVGGTMPLLMDNKTSLVHQALTLLGLVTDKTTVRDVAGEIEWAAVEMLDAQRYLQVVASGLRTPPVKITPDQMVKLMGMYKKLKYERGVIDYEDLLTLTCGMYRARPDIAAQFRNVYKHFVVDEFQDISPLQYALLREWLGPNNRNLCVVGDASQTIYTFAGASDEFLCQFEKYFPGSMRVELTRNYRCRPQIVQLANQIISADPQTAAQAVQLQATRLSPAKGQQAQSVFYSTYFSEAEEAQGVTQQIQQLLSQGVKPEQVAILFRTNSQTSAFEKQLKKLAIPYTVRADGSFFSRPEVKSLLAAAHTHSLVSPLVPPTEPIEKAARELGWQEKLPQGDGEKLTRWHYLNTLVEIAREKQLEGITLTQLVQTWNAMAADDVAPAAVGITLGTIHSAKGLEWEHVWIPSLREGVYPHSSSKSQPQIQEERRLLYVAVTRAKETLHLSFAQHRPGHNKYGKPPRNKLSRFMAQLWPAEIEG